MCGRFTQRYTWAEVHTFLSVFGPPRNLQPHYNIAPTDPVGVVRPGPNGRELVSMHWGLIPAWWKKTAKELPASAAVDWALLGLPIAGVETPKSRTRSVHAAAFAEQVPIGDREAAQPLAELETTYHYHSPNGPELFRSGTTRAVEIKQHTKDGHNIAILFVPVAPALVRWNG